jgi:hypothetical protein
MSDQGRDVQEHGSPSRLPELPVLRLLVLTPGRIASTQILDQILQGLAEQGALEITQLYDNGSTIAEQQEAILDADVVFFFRSFTQSSLALLRFARQRDKIVVYSTDDDFRELDPETPLGRLHLAPQTLAAFEAMITEADLVWLFTPEMEERYRGLARRIAIGRLPSFVEINAPRRTFEMDERTSDATLVVGYGGSSTHESDLRVVVRPLLDALERWPHVRVQFVNYAPDELANHPRVEVRHFMGDLLMYYDFLRQTHWDIGLAPLLDSRFNRGKTSNKYREYAGFGIPGIYSRVSVYAEHVRHLETGWLADHDEAGFAEGLRILVERPGLRARIRSGALQDASSRFSLRGAQLHFLGEISRLAIQRRTLSWRRPRLLAVGYERTASMRIGALQPLRRLGRAGLVELRAVEPDAFEPDDLLNADAAFVMRAFEHGSLPLLETAHERQVPFVAAWDDDFLWIPPGGEVGAFYRHPATVHAIRRFLSESSLVLASTPPLFARSAEFNPNVLETPYGLDEESLPPPRPKSAPEPVEGGAGRADAGSRLRIGFFGSNEALSLPWMVEALRLLRRRFGDQLEIEAIGVTPTPELEGLLDHVQPAVADWAESLSLLRDRGWSVGLAPLADSMFNASKQGTKFRDYTWAGAVMACSRVPAYQRVLLDGIHARFADESPEDWASVVGFLLDRPDERARLLAGARMLLDQVHVQSLTDAWWVQVLWRLGAAREARSRAGARLDGSGRDLAVEPLSELLGAEPAQYVPLGRSRRYHFIAAHDLLCGVEVCIGGGAAGGSRGKLDFVLSLDDGQVLRRGTADLGGSVPGQWVRCGFDGVLHSEGRAFVLDLRRPAGFEGTIEVLESSRIGSPRATRAIRRLGFASVVAAPFLRVLYATDLSRGAAGGRKREAELAERA